MAIAAVPIVNDRPLLIFHRGRLINLCLAVSGEGGVGVSGGN